MIKLGLEIKEEETTSSISEEIKTESKVDDDDTSVMAEVD